MIEDIIDRVSRMRNEEPCWIIDHFGGYRRLVFYFRNNIILAFQEFAGGTIYHEILQQRFDKKFDRLKQVEPPRCLANHEREFLKVYEEWFLEHTLLGD